MLDPVAQPWARPIALMSVTHGRRGAATARRRDGGARRAARRALRGRRRRHASPASSAREDDLRPRRRPRARRHAAGHEPDVHDRPPLRGAESRSRTSTSTGSRASTPEDWGDLEPYFDGTIAFVEWPEHAGRWLPPARAVVTPRARRRVAPPRDDRRPMTILAFDTATSLRRRARACRTGDVLGERRARRRPARGRRRARRRPGRDRRDRRRPRARELHQHPDRARDGARRSPSRSASPSPARRRSTRSRGGTPVIDARRGEVFTAGPRVAQPGGARRRRADARRRRRVRYRDALRGGAARRSRRTTTSVTVPRPAARSIEPRRPGDASSRSTSATPTRSRPHDCRRGRDPRARPRRPRRDRGDRAARLPHAVVELDVRVRAREADLDLPRRVRGRAGSSAT